jgi:hypothetical protein
LKLTPVRFPLLYLRVLRHFAEKKLFPEEKKRRSHTKKTKLQRFRKGSSSCTFVSFATSPKKNFSRGKEKEVPHKENEASKVHEGFLFVYLHFLCDFAEKKLFPEEKKKRSHTKKTKLQRFTKGSSSCSFVSFATSPKKNFSGGKEKEVLHKENEASTVHEGVLFVLLRFLCDFAEKKLFGRKRKGGFTQRKRSFKGSRRVPLRAPVFFASSQSLITFIPTFSFLPYPFPPSGLLLF